MGPRRRHHKKHHGRRGKHHHRSGPNDEGDDMVEDDEDVMVSNCVKERDVGDKNCVIILYTLTVNLKFNGRGRYKIYIHVT